ncbi:drug/metabolite transporter (DMT)-like permease [Hoeflea marina]|uniref:Drug/metabolite transporter (DMT)-like permease n=1 Tax=Hoeflea marina TaxID=274592 RepID=A0A317PLY4_9HYPH|nr:DMT family transporter [Hoeflea marina]PWW01756.1 drug/metabolite transporter (DMT)-like permease [Hoeflea marina]
MTLDRIAPALFVLLWSTGWIVAKYAAPHADPLTFLSLRYALAIAVFGVIVLATGALWPTTRSGWAHAIVSGVFLHGIYLGGVWWAISHGVPSSISGLIAALQPIMTAMVAPVLVGERLTQGQRLGILLGFVGLAIAILPGLLRLEAAVLSAALLPLAVNVVSMISVTGGTLYQKRFLQEGDLRAIATLQYLGAFAVTLPMAWLIEPMRIDWTLEFILAMAWSVFGLSLVSIALLLYLIRRGQVSRAASLIYLVPPTVAVQSWAFFGEEITLPLIVGTVIVVVGVWLTNRKPRLPA